MAFNIFKGSGKQPSSGEYGPEETPLGPRTYPRVGNEPTGLTRPSAAPADQLTGRRSVNKREPIHWQEIWRTKKWWILAGVGVLIVAIVAITTVLGRSRQGSLVDQVHVTITGPAKVTVGSDVAYDVQIANDSGTTLTATQLIVIYPPGFSYTSSEPSATNKQGTEFAPGDIAGGGGYSARINGRLAGDVQSQQQFLAQLIFSPLGTSEKLQVEASATTTIETAAFTFNATGPETGLPNEPVTFALTLANNQQQPLDGLQVQADYPSGFTFQKADPTATTDNNVWKVGSLGMGESKKISVTGKLSGAADEIKRFVFSAGVLDKDGSYVKETEVEKIVKLSNPTITITQTIDGKSELTADADTALEYVVSFENTGPSGLTNLTLEVGFTPDIWDVKTLSVGDGGALKSGNLIRWDGVSVPALRTLEAGQKAEVTFSVQPLRQLAITGLESKNFAVTTTPTIKIGSTGVNGNPVTVKYKADIAAGVTSTTIIGPNPPVISQESTYQITWTLTDLYNDLEGARFVGSVPAGAAFVVGSGHVSAGEDLVFNAATGQVLWNIGKVPANTGKQTASLTATFKITLTPQANAQGKKLLLVSKQQFTARDVWTSEDRTAPLPDVNTPKLP